MNPIQQERQILKNIYSSSFQKRQPNHNYTYTYESNYKHSGETIELKMTISITHSSVCTLMQNLTEEDEIGNAPLCDFVVKLTLKPYNIPILLPTHLGALNINGCLQTPLIMNLTKVLQKLIDNTNNQHRFNSVNNVNFRNPKSKLKKNRISHGAQLTIDNLSVLVKNDINTIVNVMLWELYGI